MPTQTLPGALGELRGGTSLGYALTTAPIYIPIPDGAAQMSLVPRNFAAAAVAVRYLTNPYLIVLKTTDALAAVANLTDYSQNAQDGSTATDVVLSSLSTAANLDFLYIGSHQPFAGVAIDVDLANANASVLTVKYWKSDSTWADISVTDGTDSGGAAFAVDGNATWTIPTDWQPAALNTFGEYTAADTLLSSIKDTALTFKHSTTKLYWTRWQWSATLDSSTSANSMMAINRSTAYYEIPSGLSQTQAVTKGPGFTGCIQALTDAGTANLLAEFATAGRAYI